MPETVPNQKVIITHKEKTDAKHPYAMINVQAMQEASRQLKAGAFRMWMYFASQGKDYGQKGFAISSKAIEEYWGIKRDQYNTAIAELIQKGFLVNEYGCYWNFYEISTIPCGKSL